MPSLRRSGLVGICVLIGVASALSMIKSTPAGSVGARHARCSAPPQAGANYSNCNLTGVNFTNADLAGANLKKATLTGAALGGADLSGATLTRVVSGAIGGTPASLPSDWAVVDGYLVGPLANLTGANLSGASLEGADLLKVNFASANLSGSDLTDATLKGTDLQGTVLAGATLTGIKSGGKIIGTPASLPPNWALVGATVRYLVGPAANLAQGDFYGTNLAGTDLTDANLFGANFSFANLNGADLTGATLTGVTWSDTTCPDGTNSNNDANTCVNNL